MQFNKYDHMLCALNTEQTLLLEKLDKIFTNWGIICGAQSMIMPLLLPINDLAKLDVYQNFPQQAIVTTNLNLDQFVKSNTHQIDLESIAVHELQPAQFALPTAACYAVYLYFNNNLMPEQTLITVLGQCCRQETHYVNLCRALSFHMREIIALGRQEFVEQHLLNFTNKILKFAELLNLPLLKIVATDPFFQANNSKLLLQKLYPNKYEFVYNGLAVASVNMHRNFFGERCNIKLANSSYISTSCVAFGLERWLAILYKHYGSWQNAIDNIDAIMLNERK